MMVYVMMSKRHLEKYLEMLDERIEYLKIKDRRDDGELALYISMRNHAFDALERLL